MPDEVRIIQDGNIIEVYSYGVTTKSDWDSGVTHS